LHLISAGSGKSLLLVDGIGSHSGTWARLIPTLAQARLIIAIDLPGHGQSPAESDSGTFAGLARSVEQFLSTMELVGVDMVGSSLGGRLVLELARCGQAGSVVALDPGGFSLGLERTYLHTRLLAAVAMLRGAAPFRSFLARNVVTRTMLLSLLSARPWTLSGDQAQAELDGYCRTRRAHSRVLEKSCLAWWLHCPNISDKPRRGDTDGRIASCGPRPAGPLSTTLRPFRPFRRRPQSCVSCSADHTDVRAPVRP